MKYLLILALFLTGCDNSKETETRFHSIEQDAVDLKDRVRNLSGEVAIMRQLLCVAEHRVLDPEINTIYYMNGSLRLLVQRDNKKYAIVIPEMGNTVTMMGEVDSLEEVKLYMYKSDYTTHKCEKF